MWYPLMLFLALDTMFTLDYSVDILHLLCISSAWFMYFTSRIL